MITAEITHARQHIREVAETRERNAEIVSGCPLERAISAPGREQHERRRHSGETRARARQLFGQGWTVLRVAEAIGVPPGTVDGWFRNWSRTGRKAA